MPKPQSEKTVTLISGQLYIYKRPKSPLWQTRFKVAGRWYRLSTKQALEVQARERAYEQFMETKYREKIGLPTINRKFSYLAQLAKSTMDDDTKNGNGKVMYSHYKSVIDTYLVPFFGKKNVDSIGYNDLQEFELWRREKMERTPAASTINNHNAALNRVFEEGVARGFLQPSKVPKLKNRGKKSDVRPTFTLDEYRQLYRFMRGWKDRGRGGKPRHMRYLLRDYVLFLAASGIR
ncbi:MAG TPA: site-specific integrase, partial [Candidatus Saccharibacteria bacterium]|nr:site-specific integrase [Candidatus Saccharibacteria bacterium]